MEYKITQEQLDLIGYFRTKSRFDNNDIGKLKDLYTELINQHLKKIVDWRCPYCMRLIIQELIRFSEKAELISEKIILSDESKVVKRGRPPKSGKQSK